MKNRNEGLADHWQTPPDFKKKIREKLGGEYFDPCPINHDISLWDGLLIPWYPLNYINPPYSLGLKTDFVKKGIAEKQLGNTSIFLIPVSTSTKLYHDFIKPNMDEQEFLRGRLPFIGINDKGQYVNYHLLQEIDKNEMIPYMSGLDKDGKEVWKEIKKYVRNSGQHDSMLITFRGDGILF